VMSYGTQLKNSFSVEFMATVEAEHHVMENVDDWPDSTGYNTAHHYVISPVKANNDNDDEVGFGLSMGTNGITTVEHKNDHWPGKCIYEGPIEKETWHHVVVTVTEGVHRVYLNGILACEGTDTEYINVLASSIGWFGVFSWEFDNDFCGTHQGKLANYKVQNYPMSANEVLAASIVALGGLDIRVNFGQINSFMGHGSYFADNGQFYAHRDGARYGWNCENLGDAKDRWTQLNEGYGDITWEESFWLQNSLIFPDRNSVCETNGYPKIEWNYQVPNGDYLVEINYCDVAFETYNKCKLQGVDADPMFGAKHPLCVDMYDDHHIWSVNVTITDGFVTFSGDRADDCYAVHSIHITSVNRI